MSWVRRTVWDGDRELYEIQRRLGANDSSDVKQDSSGMLFGQSGSSPMDPNPFFGRVAYTYGHVIDQPLSIVRFNYSDLTDPNGNVRDWRVLQPFAIFPLWNSRGQAQAGAFADGGVNKCETWNTHLRCVKHVWPQCWFALARPRLGPVAWHGTIPEDKRDAAGTHYRRNRYYDPASGRFTQPDPIGLAGGLNSYGFAAGDPVSYSDPYGLKVEFETAAARRVWNQLQRRITKNMNSRDPEERNAAFSLNLDVRSVERSENTWSINVGRQGAGVRGEYGGAKTYMPLRGWFNDNARTVMDAGYTQDRWNLRPAITLAHEMGHALAIMANLRDMISPSLRTENFARILFGCAPSRTSHSSTPQPCR